MLIQKVHAQAAPTFDYDGPFEPPTPTPPSSEEAVVSLSSSISTLQIGQTVVCNIEIQTSATTAQSYNLTIEFNESSIEVVDANASQDGIQLNFLDTASTEQINSVNNTGGTIQLQANITGNAETINRRVAEITFRAIRTGTSIVSINKAQSSVTDGTGADILGTTTSINLTITGETGETPPDGTLPGSGVLDAVANLGAVLTGVLLLYVGVKIVVDKRKVKRIGL